MHCIVITQKYSHWLSRHAHLSSLSRNTSDAALTACPIFAQDSFAWRILEL